MDAPSVFEVTSCYATHAFPLLNKRDMTFRPKHDPHNGLLHFKSSTPLSGYARYFPSPDIEPFVEHYWTVEWNLPQPTLRETLPYPCAHIVLEPGGVAVLAGVTTKTFSRVLEPAGRVLGAKFRPGGLRPFVSQSVSAFTDKTFALSEIFGKAAQDLDLRALAHADHHAAFGVIEAFLRELRPRADASLELATRIAACIAQDRNMKTVEQLGAESRLGVRTLQRLFGDYIGVSPKWMIRRYRLQEAAERMAAAQAVDWPELALDLGYADQAHFIRDFKAIVGQAPAEYFDSLAAISNT